jgi:ATP-binding cassette subfamily B protein
VTAGVLTGLRGLRLRLPAALSSAVPELDDAFRAGLRRALPDLALAAVVLNLLGLALPLVVLQVYDRIIPHRSVATLALLLMGACVALGLEVVVRVVRGYVVGLLAARFDHQITCKAFRRLLDAPVGEAERDGAGIHLERLRAVTLVREFYSGQSVLALLDLPFTVIYLALLAWLGGWLVVVPILLLAVFGQVALWIGGRLRADLEARAASDERRYSFIGEAVAGIHSIKTMAMEALMRRRYDRLQEANAHGAFAGTRHSTIAVNLGVLFSQLGTVLTVSAGAFLVVHQGLSSGALVACIMLVGRAFQPLQSALATWVRFQRFLVARRQLERLFALPARAGADAPVLPRLHGRIELAGVTVGLPGRERLLFDALDLAVAPGECVGIVGDSGSGKSSLLALIGGMLRPDGGRVGLDGHDPAAFAPASVARRVATMPQQGVVFEGSILDNVAMFDPASYQPAREAGAILGLDRLVAGMRNGWDTLVGNTAADSLPAGVRQRIAIARTLAPDPQVVLFDEANIALDAVGDGLLRQWFDGQRGKRTMVLVTHRPSLLRLCDRVLYLRDGRLHARPAAVAAAAPAQARPAMRGGLAHSLIARFSVHSDLAMCLSALLAALGWQGTPRQLAEALPHFVDSLDVKGLLRTMGNLGFAARAVDTTLDELDARLLPALFLPADGPGLVLLREQPGGGIMAFHGGEVANLTVPRDQRPGTAYVFQPAEEVAAATEAGSWVLGVFARFRRMAALAAVVSLVINLLMLAVPLTVMGVFDRVVPSADAGLVAALLPGVLVVLAIDAGLRTLRARLLAFIGARAEFIVGTALFGRLMRLPALQTESINVGSQIARLKDFDTLREIFTGPPALLAFELPAVAVFVVTLAVVNPWVLVVVAASVALYAGLGLATRATAARLDAEAGRAAARRHEFLADALAKLRTLKQTGAEARWHERLRALSGRAVAAEFRAGEYTHRVAAVSQGLGGLTALATVLVSVLAVLAGQISVGAVVASLVLIWRVLGPLQTAFASVGLVARLRGSIQQIDNFMRLAQERPEAAKAALPDIKGEVAFSRVSFRYSNDADPSLMNITFTVRAGQVVAVAGPNGAGKSTLLKLITGLYQPQVGSIRLDRIDIRQFDPAQLRALIAYVPQRCELFYGTVYQNLRLADPTASDALVRWAADLAGLTADVEALPNGFAARITDGGADKLPHGFRQRMGLARAYVRRAPVMLFDEPGNGLDAAGDLAFQQAIPRLRGQSTIFIVSHRPSHLKLADTVVYMEEGCIRQAGTFDQLRGLILGPHEQPPTTPPPHRPG